MIVLTKLDGNMITINADEIESIESAHDSTLSMISGRKFIVKESYSEIIEKVINFKRKCFEKLPDKN